jgi:hypothetical protein
MSTLDYIKSLTAARDRNEDTHGKTANVLLADRLMTGAHRLDLFMAQDLAMNFRYQNASVPNPNKPSTTDLTLRYGTENDKRAYLNGLSPQETTEAFARANEPETIELSRNTQNPAYYDHESIQGKDWADDQNEPLKGKDGKADEEWNKGRRATASGTQYTTNEDDHPINPYMNTGINGRGCLGQFGPNHAVDNGVLVIRPDEDNTPTLYAVGILRKFDNDAPAFSGGFAKFREDESGTLIFDNEAVTETKVEELFEEMISGSVEVLPENKERVETQYQERIDDIVANSEGERSFTQQERDEIYGQVETEIKMEQVKDLDPGFLERLHEVVAESVECFAGPILNDNRSTNNAWIESRLSWFVLDDDNWNYIVGDDPKFDYALTAGDDASDTVYHRVDEDLVATAFASHGPMFAYMAASYILESENNGDHIEPSILSQLEEIANYLETIPEPSNFPHPQSEGQAAVPGQPKPEHP